MAGGQEGSTRERIVAAAETLMRTIGLARSTTREIARAAGCSEAALYKHFRSKEELFLAVLKERLPPLQPMLAGLLAGRDERPVEACMADVVRLAALFYTSTFPIGASLFAEPSLLQRHQEQLRTLNAGPHKPIEALAGWLRLEQQRGRIRADADTDAAAHLLMGSCFQRAFLLQFMDTEPPHLALDVFAPAAARTVMAGLR